MAQRKVKSGTTPEGEAYVIYRVGDREHLRLYIDIASLVPKSAKVLSALKQNFLVIGDIGIWTYSNDDCDNVGFFKLYHRSVNPYEVPEELKQFNESEEVI